MQKSFTSLRHHVRPLTDGGMVLLLDTGALINAESDAMLQALYSRDPQSVYKHLEAIAEKGPEKFMAGFYVGYGHKSIGDCGSVTLFVEGVSMLCAKAIQDWMLYSGQEVSTRYVDFSLQRFATPAGILTGKPVLDELRALYLFALPRVEADLKVRFPRASEEKESLYDKAIKARAFDIVRGFLPAGATTSVAWHTNLRQAADKIALLRHHPLREVRTVAVALEGVLIDGYPSSFGHKRYDATENYNASWMSEAYYLCDADCPPFSIHRDSVAYDELEEGEHLQKILRERPPKTELPKFLAELGEMQVRYLLDFASFRDIQRQRAVNQRMPLLDTTHGFEEWYLSELPTPVRDEAERVLKRNRGYLASLQDDGMSKTDLQYYIPMGYKTANRLTGDIPALVYLAELRATRFVHPTLQFRAHALARELGDRLGRFGLQLFVDDEVGRFDVRRGAQDISKKE